MAEDRYGPAPTGNRGYGVLPEWTGPRVTWTGKVAPTAIAPVSASPYRRQAIVNGALRTTSAMTDAPMANPYAVPPPAPAVPAPAAVAVAPPPPPPAPVAPAAENAPWRRLTGGYNQGSTSQLAPPAQPTTPVGAAQPLAAAAPASATASAGSDPEYRTDVSAKSTPASEGEQARYYSLHRAYGETPDKVPIPEKSQVFLAGAPLGGDLDDQENEIDDTGKTAAAKKARVAADWGASANDAPAATRVQIMRP